MKNVYIYLILASFLFSNGYLLAQEKCSTSHRKQQALQNPEIAKRVAEIEAFTQDWISEHKDKKVQNVITLPVVVHVLYHNQSANISDAQVLSQFQILNDDFRLLNDNFEDTPAAFKPFAADVEIEFCLASFDPNGNPTSGITRKQVDSDFDYDNDYYNPDWGGQSPWDNTSYINVWITEELDGLGFAYSPGTADEEDGIVVVHKSWGNTGTAEAPNDLGRTGTHEFGHYLNLDHVWGPEDGGCGEDDFVNDTPLQYEENYGCDNTFPLHDDCTPSGNGVMFMNHMDYGDDACLTMFTEGQKLRMLAAANGPRASLLESNACNLMSNTTNLLAFDFMVSPNPAQDIINLSINYDKELRIALVDMNGKVLKEAVMQNNLSLAVDDVAAGIYFIKVVTKNAFATQKIVITK